MLVNERIGYVDANYSVNYRQFSYGAKYGSRVEILPINSTPYANAHTHNLVRLPQTQSKLIKN